MHRDLAMLAISAFMTWSAWDSTLLAFRSGVFRIPRHRRGRPVYRRTREPVRYWLSMLGASLAVLTLLAFTLFFAVAVFLDLR